VVILNPDQVKHLVLSRTAYFQDQSPLIGSYPKSAIEGEGFSMQQVAVGVGGLNPRFI
jgi:hypothetical protein